MLVCKNVKYGVLRQCGCDNSSPLEHRARRNLLQRARVQFQYSVSEPPSPPARARWQALSRRVSPREHTALDQYAYYKRYANYFFLTALSREVCPSITEG